MQSRNEGERNMSEFRINLKQAAGEVGTCRGLARSIGSIQSDLNRTMRSLDFSISQKERIRKRLEMQNDALKEEQRMVQRAASSLQEIVRCYEQTEKGLCGVRVDRLPQGQAAPPSPSWLEKLKQFLKENLDLEERLSVIKKLLKGCEKFGENDEAGIAEDVLSYFEDLMAFFLGDKKGITGAADFCDLTKSSIDVWKGLYDYYSDIYENARTGFFSDIGKRNVKIVGLTASLFGLCSSLLSATDGIGKKSIQSVIADYIDCGKDVFSVIKSGYELKHIKDAASLAKIKEGPWSALGIYMSIGEATAVAGAQIVRSQEKYYADGKWDIGDTGATMIDVSMAGVRGLVHSLTFGTDDLFFGWLQEQFGNHGDPNLNFAEQAAEGYKYLGELIGKNLGKWILSWRK